MRWFRQQIWPLVSDFRFPVTFDWTFSPSPADATGLSNSGPSFSGPAISGVGIWSFIFWLCLRRRWITLDLSLSILHVQSTTLVDTAKRFQDESIKYASKLALLTAWQWHALHRTHIGLQSWVDQGLTSHQTHYRSYRGRVLWVKRTNRVTALKEERS